MEKIRNLGTKTVRIHDQVLISVFITVKSMNYAHEESDIWTDFDLDKGVRSAFGWRSKNDTV